MLAKYGPESIGIVAGPLLSLEEATTVERFAREAISTTCWSIALEPQDRMIAERTSKKANSVLPEQLAECDCVFLVGDLFSQYPVVSRGVLSARYAKRGNRVITVDPRSCATIQFSDEWVKVAPAGEWAALAYLLKQAIRLTGGGGTKWERISDEALLSISGTSRQLLEGILEELLRATNLAVWVSSESAGELAQRLGSTLASVLSSKARELLIYESGNGLGVFQVARRGMFIEDFLRLVARRKFRALFAFGYDLFSEYPSESLKRGLNEVEFLVAGDMYMTETGKVATVFFPLASWLEAEGSYLSLDGRIINLEPVLPPPGDGQPLRRLLELIARRLGRQIEIPEAPAISEEKAEKENLESELMLLEKAVYEAVESQPRVSRVSKEYPYVMEMCRDPLHTGNGLISRNSRFAKGPAWVEMSYLDFRNLGLSKEGFVKVTSEFGEGVFLARPNKGLPKGMVAACKAYPEVRGLLGRYASLTGEKGTPWDRVAVERW
ncbi:MAG: molybdopterin-dependent oxidoreductase, partial [Bacillota bacterium]